MRTSYLALASLIAGSLGAGCTDEADDLNGRKSSVVIDNRIAFNRIAFNRIAFNRIAFNRIAFNRIVNFQDAADLLDTPEDQELFSFIVSCAIPDGVTLTAPDPNGGPDLEFFGEIGLAPDWQTRALKQKERRWVTSCLLARVNQNNVTVQISLRGPHPSLTATPSEAVTYSLEEGAFYGDVFTTPTGDIAAYACRGSAQAAGEVGGLIDRDCTEPDPANPGKTVCGLFFAGDCADFAPPANSYACGERTVEGNYGNCSTTAAFPVAGDDDDDDDDGHGHGHHGHGHHGHSGGGHRGGHDDDDDDDDDDDNDADHDDNDWHHKRSGKGKGNHGKSESATSFDQVITVYLRP